ncbi:CsgE family curli-type amyloid fiber assembly protein [Rubrivirga sp. IMCC43871]|uniref:CsgE family curli-type amyloid fiber assembly protein n=1 Tax=Rubrivirga sp. IMCC43871 TaxID=3391575 RepID=UPI00398FB39B
MRVFALALLLAPGIGSAQPPPNEGLPLIEYGRQRTYHAIVAETRLLHYVPTAATAVEEAEQNPTLGIGRLVVDETISRTGSYFYDVFYRLWQPGADAQFLSVAVFEQPLPGQGTLIGVRLDGELVFQARLSPREEEAETLAQQAVAATARRLPRG